MANRTGDSRISIFAALAGNIAVALIKFAAYALSASSSMLVEAIHSLVDSANQGLLLFGLHRGARAPDDTHPFGYGLEAYFWTFIVALLIFVAGGVFSIVEGVFKLLHPRPVGHVVLTLMVLAVSAAFEIGSYVISMREANQHIPRARLRTRSRPGLVDFVHHSRDPGIFEVLVEDIASLLGLLFAALGVVGSAWLGWLPADGVAAVAIGCLLVLMAGVVVFETHSLLTGEGASSPVMEEIKKVLTRDSRVTAVGKVQSLHLGPQEILVAATLKFSDDLTGPELERAAGELAAGLKSADARITRFFLRPPES